MSLRRRLNGREPILDLTSASDIIFTLLLFFILTQNFLTTLPMHLPTVTTGETASADHPLRIAVTASGTVSWNDHGVSSSWKSDLAAFSKTIPGSTSVLLELDHQAPAGLAVEILDILRQAGLGRVAFVATPQRDDGQAVSAPQAP